MNATATIPDLWPTDFNVGSEPSPATILRRQGYILGERTQDVVYGEVESSLSADGANFHHTLFLTAPYCKVRQPVLTATHGLSGYPAELTLQFRVGDRYKSVRADDPSGYTEKLRELLASPQIVELVRSLIAQAREMDDE